MRILLEKHARITFHLEEFSPKIIETKTEKEIKRLHEESSKLTSQLEDSNRKLRVEIQKTKQEVSDLRERVATLEKIVTDEKYSLNKEFENLRKDDAA